MAVKCPYCDHHIPLQDPKPGRYTTKCPQCAKKFLLRIPADPAKPPVVAAMKSQRDEPTAQDPEPAATDPSATVPHVTAAASEAEATDARSATSDDANATAAHVPTEPARSGSAADTAAMGFAVSSPSKTESLTAPSSAPESLPADAPTALGGYQLIRELGRGGMGSVYLAKQVALGRNVALKTMKPLWASDPTFVARFTREAFAAAQLVHHNVVQIYDFGEDHGTTFFSMEYVEGQSLADLLRKQKKLDGEAAVGYVLQAARGLKFAHDQSMIHRDVKPDNLMINTHGVIKVADLGLVKTPALAEEIERREAVEAKGTAPAEREDSALTRADIAMGTPAFMAPEQGRDAAGVDARADIYSLGCTLYDLVTGRPPFEGKSAMEVITKHQSEPIVPPEVIVKRVPKALSEIILKMVAKRPEDRYQDLAAVIKDLEAFLGVSSTGPFTPREEHAEILERSVVGFNNSAAARLRPKVSAGFLATCGFLVLLFGLLRWPTPAGGFLGLGLLTIAASFVIHGIRTKSHLLSKTREFVFSSSVGDWLTWAAGVILFVIILVFLKLLWVWLAVCLLAVGCAWAFDRLVDKRIETERAGPISDVETMLKSLRLHGLEEDALRQFVCKYAGDHWEEFYEELFGYDAKHAAREQWGRGQQGRSRPKFGAWREPIIAWIDAKQLARREAREKKVLQKMEEKSLTAKGENLVTARRKAERAAEAMVAMASEMRNAPALTPDTVAVNRSLAKALREAARKPEVVLVTRERGLIGRRAGLIEIALGARVRFLLAAVLLAGFLAWMNQNEMIDVKKTAEQVSQAAQTAAQTQDLAKLKAINVPKVDTTKASKPLSLPMVPAAVTSLFNGFAPGVAGLILLISALCSGYRISYFALPGAAVAVWGPRLGIPTIGPLDAAWTSMAIGGALLVAGILFGRRR